MEKTKKEKVVEQKVVQPKAEIKKPAKPQYKDKVYELNLNQNNIINNFKNYEPSEGRGKIHNIKRYKKNFKLIDESYNANPISVKNAIQKLGSIKNITTQLKQLIKVKKSEVLKCVIPLFKRIWCKWFVSAENGDVLFNILTIMTLNVSRTGIEINEIAITGIFSIFIEKTSTRLAVEAVEI